MGAGVAGLEESRSARASRIIASWTAAFSLAALSPGHTRRATGPKVSSTICYCLRVRRNGGADRWM